LVPIQEIASDLESALVALDPTETNDTSKISDDAGLVACDSAFRTIVLLKLKHELECDILDTLKQKVQRGEIDPLNVYETFVADYTLKMNKFDSMVDPVKKDPSYRDFRECIFQIRHPKRPFNFEDEEQSDDELQMVSRTDDFKCPITVINYLIIDGNNDRSLQG
jgi:hypothetical protein